MFYEIEKKQYEVIITRKNNKNTYIRVKNDLKIYVTTSYFVTNNQIRKLLDRNYEYLEKTISKMNILIEKEESFYYLGKKYDVIIMPTKEIEFINNKIYIEDRKKLDKWINEKIKTIFKERLEFLYSNFNENIPYPKLKIRKMKTRWGVCNRRDNSVTLNSELIRYDLNKLDYVIIHELSHFIHFNHSKKFWDLVSEYCPNYKIIRKELKN